MMENASVIGGTRFAPGWHEGVPMHRYLGDPAVSSSRAWTVHKASPAHLRAEIDRESGDDRTPARDLGHVLHTAVLEPSELARRYVGLGTCAAILKTGNRKGSACGSTAIMIDGDGRHLCGSHGDADAMPDTGAYMVPAAMIDTVRAMRDSLRAHATADDILRAMGRREATLVARDEETGLFLRCRPDLVIEDPADTPDHFHWSVVNLKATTRSAATDMWTKDAVGMGHYFRAAFYRHVVRTVWDVEPQHFLYPVVESSPPYAVNVFRVNDMAIDAGEAEMRNALYAIADAVATDTWPAYGLTVKDLRLPEWRMRVIENAGVEFAGVSE